MEFKGTGKEWDLVELNISDMKQITVFCSNPKQVIAHIYLPDYEITPELKANGSLISKAPEMLLLLKDVFDMCDMRQFPTEQELNDIKQKVSKLIKQATEI